MKNQDLLEDYDSLPQNVKDILNTYDEEAEDLYDECKRIIHELSQIAYTADYDLSGQIVDLQKVEIPKPWRPSHIGSDGKPFKS